MKEVAALSESQYCTSTPVPAMCRRLAATAMGMENGQYDPNPTYEFSTRIAGFAREHAEIDFGPICEKKGLLLVRDGCGLR